MNSTQQNSALATIAWLIQANPDAIAVLDLALPKAPVQLVNASMAALTGMANLAPHFAPIATSEQSPLPELLGIDGNSPEWLSLVGGLASGVTGQFQCRAYRQQQEAFWAEISGHLLPPVTAAIGEHPAHQELALITVRDQSDAWLASTSLFLQNKHHEAILQEITDAVVQADSALVLNALNPAAEILTGWSEGAARGLPVADVLHLVDSVTNAPLGNPLLTTLLTGASLDWTEGASLQRGDGSQIPITYRTAAVRDEAGTLVDGILLMRNVSEATVMADAMAHLAWHDELTGLPNRSVFNDRLEQARALALRHQHECAMLLVEVANHAQVVEACGLEAGDELLQALALRLRTVFRRSDTVCRVGDTRFAVLLPSLAQHASPDLLMSKARGIALSPVNAKTQLLDPRIAVGLSIFPRDGTTVTDLLDNATAQLFA